MHRDGRDLSIRDGEYRAAGQLREGFITAALDQQIVGSRRLTRGGRRRGQIGPHANGRGTQVRKDSRSCPKRAEKRATT
jgi:hypothetical protein